MYFPVTYSATERTEERPEAVATVRELLDMIITLKLCEKQGGNVRQCCQTLAARMTQPPVVEFLRKTAALPVPSARIHRKWKEMLAAEAATAEMMKNELQ
jgi:hypothetical protein